MATRTRLDTATMRMTNEPTALQRAHALLAERPYTPAELVTALGINRNSVQKIINELREAGIIEIIGAGYAGARVWGLVGTPYDPDYATKTKLGLDVTAGTRTTMMRAVDHPAGDGVMPMTWDHLVVTAVGLGADGQPVVKLQRKDGVTWVMEVAA